MTVDGTSLSKGADLIVNDGWMEYLAVSALSSGSKAVVCYQDDYQNSNKGARTVECCWGSEPFCDGSSSCCCCDLCECMPGAWRTHSSIQSICGLYRECV